ncbi:hypothetical protein KJY73_10415 [Bowmanella sp. Y26]|uniref:hypothetical protein n=1 Tax=Bowmanella yangjiangensis TaxID=2811230 RepID=UPI001BDBD997|nr:hypothetical protein [Bowmanella yangjiangensis]MBT1063989.1 hypothetical protein [Bowmanella yangjiangensis]
MSKRCVLFATWLLFASSAMSYEIGKKAITINESPDFSVDQLNALGLEWEKNHELLTALAIQCLSDYNLGDPSLRQKPDHCDFQLLHTKPFDIFTKNGSEPPNKLSSLLPLVTSVRWPDDPTRQIYQSSSTAAKFAITVKRICSKRMEKDREEGEGIILAADGVLCASHYGSLQFLHAMEQQNGQKYRVTKQKMIDWAKFAFDFSKKNIDQNLKYCDFWESDVAKNTYPSLIDAVQVQSLRNRGWCDKRDVSWQYKLTHPRTWTVWTHLGSFLSDWSSPRDHWDAWYLSTLFSFHCDGKVYSSICDIVSDPEEVSNAALGSIIHMIQDSYSASHTNRGVNVAEPRVLCNAVDGFYSYSSQDTDQHGLSDKWPSFSCSKESETLDPVTAVAQLLWLYQNDGTTADVEALIENVLGTSSLKQDSGPGSVFGSTQAQ